jgi:hypothetical protein
LAVPAMAPRPPAIRVQRMSESLPASTDSLLSVSSIYRIVLSKLPLLSLIPTMFGYFASLRRVGYSMLFPVRAGML